MKYILQKLADGLIEKLQQAILTNDGDWFNYLFNMGLTLDSMATLAFDIELD